MDNVLNTIYRYFSQYQRDLRMAAMILTRLPGVACEYPETRALANSYMAFPVIGALVAGLAAIPASLLALANIPDLAVVAVMLAVAAMITGGMHEDGLADIADSMGGSDPSKRLMIMRDSRIGAFGVIALILILAIQLACLTAMLADGITVMIGGWLASAVLSRSMMALQAWSFAPPDNSGFAHSVGRPDQTVMLISLATGLVLALMLSGSLLVCIAAGLAGVITYGFGYLLMQYIGGVNGDGLGATQMLSASMILMVMAAA
ncbi:MAG: adenosylcobinamide-GDP ribazoletransferase [Alphaproteobacteria bacterium]|nr:adenosylcobinamide-GDP ribazoletransferase [Alphaproteobacteria bacterium]